MAPPRAKCTYTRVRSPWPSACRITPSPKVGRTVWPTLMAVSPTFPWCRRRARCARPRRALGGLPCSAEHAGSDAAAKTGQQMRFPNSTPSILGQSQPLVLRRPKLATFQSFLRGIFPRPVLAKKNIIKSFFFAGHSVGSCLCKAPCKAAEPIGEGCDHRMLAVDFSRQLAAVHGQLDETACTGQRLYANQGTQMVGRLHAHWRLSSSCSEPSRM